MTEDQPRHDPEAQIEIGIPIGLEDGGITDQRTVLAEIRSIGDIALHRQNDEDSETQSVVDIDDQPVEFGSFPGELAFSKRESLMKTDIDGGNREQSRSESQ